MLAACSDDHRSDPASPLAPSSPESETAPEQIGPSVVDVAYAESASDQAREIVAAQIAPVAEPLLSAVPHGTQLRALFITDAGEAFVDLSRDVVTAHPGGSANELLTVYTLVNALTANLPAITAVQLLVDGKEVDTLAGHVDLKRPLVKNLSWVE